MKFDVIIGNPPYQVNIPQKLKGHTRAKAIYNIFIDKSIKLNPRFMTMITPSRWLTKSAAGISEEWVDEIINSNKIKHLYDYLDAKTCFNGVNIEGGVSYFLWDSKHNGKCKYFIDDKFVFNEVLNFLNLGFIVRDSGALSIISKIKSNEFVSFSNLVSPKNFFTTKSKLTTNWKGYKTKEDNEYNIKCYINKRLESIGFAWVKLSDVERNKDSININKVYIPASLGCAKKVLGVPFLGEKNSVCSQTYLVIGYSKDLHNFSRLECENIIKYIKTKFFRYMVSIKKKTQHAARGVYELVPIQNFNEEWTDEKLYKKYNLTEEEINHIEESIRPME